MTQNAQSTKFSISGIAIRRHIATLVITLAVVVIGVFFISTLQVDLLPSITYPRIGVRVNAPGLSPDVAIDEVTRPLEEALSATEGVVQVYSQTREGQVSIDLFFEPGGNIDQALNETTATFNRARNQLPDTIEEPRLFKVDPSQLPIYEFALTSSSLSPSELRIFADEELARELGVVQGVANVDVSGGVDEEVRVLVDLERLQAQGIGLKAVLDKLEASNQDISGGRILGENSEPLTRAIGRFSSADELRNLSFEVANSSQNTGNIDPSTSGAAVAPTPSRQVYLRDFAQVIDGTQKQRVFVQLNGQPAVKVSLQKQPDANTIAVVDAAKQRIAELQRAGAIASDLTLVPTLDESVFIAESLNSVTEAALSGAVLAALSVLLFLGSLRQTFIIALTIPLCTLAAAIAMNLCGFSLNVFSLGGLAISIGQAVDTSVVILENITKRADLAKVTDPDASRNGHRVKDAIALVEQSSQEVESSLLASTAANLVSVLPFVLIGGFVSLLFNELILTICFAVAASLLVAITVVPMLSSRLLTVRWSSGIGQFWILKQFNHRVEDATRGYANALHWALTRRWLVIGAVGLIFASSSLWMITQIPQEILPQISTGQANLNAQFPPGTPIATSRKVMAATDEILQQQPETAYVFTTIGGSLFGNTTNENALRSSSNITLKPGTDVEAFVAKVNKAFRKLNLVDIRLRLSPGQVRGLILNNSPVRGADVDVMLQGQDTQALEQAGKEVLQALEEQVTLAQFRPDADDRQPEFQIRPDRERLARLNLTIQEIGDTLETAVQGTVPTQLQRGDRLVDVRVEVDEASMQRPSQLSRLPLFMAGNRQIRLGDVAKIELGQAPGQIQRINQRQVFIMAGNLNEGATLGAAIAQVNKVLSQIDLPEGISTLPSAAAESNRQLQGTLPLLGGLASFLVFVVMAVQYNSLIDPLVIMLTIPLALAGGILGLFITQTAIGATVIVGAVLLVGIVVNNAIIMVELANQILEQEASVSEVSPHEIRRMAILKAAPQRLRPILMTTITTVLGMFPLSLGIGQGSEFLQPLGIVVFSGLSIATLLTLFIIPCLYLLIHELFAGLAHKPMAVETPLLTSPEPIRKLPQKK
jgi:multidrug efflux pump subunit AcrB